MEVEDYLFTWGASEMDAKTDKEIAKKEEQEKHLLKCKVETFYKFHQNKRHNIVLIASSIELLEIFLIAHKQFRSNLTERMIPMIGWATQPCYTFFL